MRPPHLRGLPDWLLGAMTPEDARAAADAYLSAQRAVRASAGAWAFDVPRPAAAAYDALEGHTPCDGPAAVAVLVGSGMTEEEALRALALAVREELVTVAAGVVSVVEGARRWF